MTTATSKFQLGTAALALAAAATLAPVVAQADSMAPLRPALTSFSQSLGNTAGDPVGAVCTGTTAADCTLVTAEQANALSSANASSTSSWLKPVFQNQLWWFGTPNPTPPTQTVVYTFYPLNLVPGFLKPLFGWFENVNYESCILGWTTTIGPYGTVTGSYSRGCA